ncbi:MAG: electron transfer flavoprotein alpha/ beta subunit [Candidatus Tectomicrobia bacterium]|uniref:Electron transfer flavoprotein alpha/ beta subunit n=1 Tax=Tectimicrobiota bacterium TaxID=2528274 RepID=A0A937VY63_UNCTE|nr:electron transfer flavoprotein alpha/ beta subunit [Candidatus Tectomicrobia bacterium]
MKIAVCIKYVPVIAQMRFDPTARTLVRDGVASEINPFDRLAVVCAAALKMSPEDQVLAIAMGPPQAREGLLHCLALGADRAILLSDRALAGSDTLATARALALALAPEHPDVILCGRNSTDAETGQVGPELAELLDILHISQVRRLAYHATAQQMHVERLTDEGHQVLACALPALFCVTEGVAPERYPRPEELEAAQHKPLAVMDCTQLGADTALFGPPGSPTVVEALRPVTSTRLGRVITDTSALDAARQVAKWLHEHWQTTGTATDKHASAQVRYPQQRQQSIWVVAERQGTGLRRVTLEMLGKARALTAHTRSEVVTLCPGPLEESLVRELATYGADRVLGLGDAPAAPVWTRALGQALAEAVATAQPHAVLFAATATGRDLAARLAARLQLGLTGDAIDLEVDTEGHLIALKPALGDQVIAPIRSKTLPTLVTLRPGVLSPGVPDMRAQALVETLSLPAARPSEPTLLSTQRTEHADAVALTQASIVLGVGMGLGGPEHLPAVQALASALGAALATTRNVVHSQWLPPHLQVGVSGRSIAPRLYLAVGIRGAFNHTVGIQQAGVIIALNRNPRAAIFKAADYGIVGDWQTYLPALVEALRPVLESAQG